MSIFKPYVGHVPYTRLQDTRIMSLAVFQYAINGLDYHNFDHHIVANYTHMENLGTPYDVNLDLANLLHDVLMGEDAEIRCMDFAREHATDVLGADIGKVCELIASTIEHTPKCEDPRLAMIDLMSFASDSSIRNADTELLRLEAMRVKGSSFDQAAWAQGTIAYASGLQGRILADLPSSAVSPRLNTVWRDIALGAGHAVDHIRNAYLTDRPEPN